MRLVTFTHAGSPQAHVGALLDGDQFVLDLSATHPRDEAFRSMQDLIEAGPDAWDRAREACAGRGGPVLRREAVRLLAPVPRPIQMRDFGCFSEHFINCGITKLRRRAAAEPDPEAAFRHLMATQPPRLPHDYMTRPRFYTCNRLSVVGDGTVVPWPELSNRLDFELEFGIFIGRPARDVSEERAAEHIFGYTLFNDMTMRDVQAAEERTGGKNKDFDCGNVMGPCIVTADELPDPYALRAMARVNGEVWCDNNTSTMDRHFEQIIAYMSQSQTLHAGEFFASGTVGRGCGFEHDRYLSPGDRVELEMEGIGTLAISVGPRSAA